MIVEVDQHDLGQLAVHVASVRGFGLVFQINIDDLWAARSFGKIAKEGGNGDVTVVWSFGANGCFVRVDWLPCLVPVVCALVHMGAGDVVCCHQEVGIDTLCIVRQS